MTDLTASVPATAPPIPTLITRYLNGESIQTLAAECAVSRQTIYNWIHSHVTDQHYPDLVRQALVTRIAQADDLLDAATTALDIARAREIAKFSRWDAERRLPQLFGPKQEISSRSQSVVVHVHRADRPLAIRTTTHLVENRNQDADNVAETLSET